METYLPALLLVLLTLVFLIPGGTGGNIESWDGGQ